jgi:hypothetical protein
MYSDPMLSFELVIAVLAGVVGALVPAAKEILQLLLRNSKGKKLLNTAVGKVLLKSFELDRPPDTHKALFAQLAQASEAMDGTVRRIQEFTHARELAVTELENQLGALTEEEGKLRERIQNLQQVPLAAAQYFASLVDKGEKSSALRDYILFFSGVVVSAIITVILKHFGLG